MCCPDESQGAPAISEGDELAGRESHEVARAALAQLGHPPSDAECEALERAASRVESMDSAKLAAAP